MPASVITDKHCLFSYVLIYKAAADTLWQQKNE